MASMYAMAFVWRIRAAITPPARDQTLFFACSPLNYCSNMAKLLGINLIYRIRYISKCIYLTNY
jgi:hypothetical protein